MNDPRRACYSEDHLTEHDVCLKGPVMSLMRYAAIFGVAATLAACGGAPANLVPTVDPRAAEVNEVAANPTAVVPTEAAAEPAPQSDAPAVELGEAPDPSSLAEGAFEVHINIAQGEVVLTPVPPVDDETDYVYGDYSPADAIIKSTSISFEINQRVNGAWYNSQVQLRLPEGATPGAYQIEANALMMEEGKVGAYVDNFTDNNLTDYVFYDSFEGTITITEIDGERASGSFAFIGRDEEGHVANVTGAFNSIGDSFKWLNEGSY